MKNLYLKNEQFIYAFRLGYRYQNLAEEGIFFRVGLTPFIYQPYEKDVMGNYYLKKRYELKIWVGLAVGISF